MLFWFLILKEYCFHKSLSTAKALPEYSCEFLLMNFSYTFVALLWHLFFSYQRLNPGALNLWVHTSTSHIPSLFFCILFRDRVSLSFLGPSLCCWGWLLLPQPSKALELQAGATTLGSFDILYSALCYVDVFICKMSELDGIISSSFKIIKIIVITGATFIGCLGMFQAVF